MIAYWFLSDRTWADRAAGASIALARGPDLRRGQAANTEAGQSTRSWSKWRSTPNQVPAPQGALYGPIIDAQSNFRFHRDSQCLVPGAEAECFTAAHIVPQSRPDVRSLTPAFNPLSLRKSGSIRLLPVAANYLKPPPQSTDFQSFYPASSWKMPYIGHWTGCTRRSITIMHDNHYISHSIARSSHNDI